MAVKNTAAFGLHKSHVQAESAVDTLRSEAFRSDDISVLLPDQRTSAEFAHGKNTKAPEGTTAAVAAGGTPGGTSGLLAGVGALGIAGLGPLSLRDRSWVPWPEQALEVP